MHEFQILMDELFKKFDLDGNGQFEFEEFRDFYLKVHSFCEKTLTIE